MQNKEYDIALKNFQKVFPKEKNNPIVLYNLGMLLSLKRITIFTAIDLLKTALKINPENETRKQLAYIYISLDQAEKIEKMLRPENLKINEAFNLQINHLRQLSDCLVKPLPNKLKKLSEGKNLESPEGRLYAFLCEVKLSKTPRDNEKVLQSFIRIENEETQCEGLVLWEMLSKDVPLDLKEKRKTSCVVKFSKNFILNRENLLSSTGLEESETAKIFQINPFMPSDPGPEILKIQRQRYKEEEIEIKEGENLENQDIQDGTVITPN